MRLKKEFEIKGKLWTLEYKWNLHHEDGDKVRGLCDFEDRIIYLERTMDAEERVEIFLHELIHATLYEAHLRSDSGLSEDAEEILCDAMTDMMTSLFTLKWKRST